MTLATFDELTRAICAGALQRGAITFMATDCDGGPAPDLHFALERQPDARPYYVLGGTPSGQVDATDRSGVGGFVDVEPGFVIGRALRASSGDEVARAGLPMRASFLTYTPMTPTPL